MIYGFNDSKEKVEVYAKSDFVVITVTKQNVEAGDVQSIKIPASGLSAMGINPNDIDKYAVVSAEQKIGDGSYYFGFVDSSYFTTPTIIPHVVKHIMPPNNELLFYIKNTDDTTQSVTARVVLMKVE